MQQTINLTFPKSWNELTDKQLLFLFTLLADGYPATDIKVKCLLKWTGTKVIGCIEGKHFMCKLVPCDNLYEIDLTRIDEVKEWFESRHKDRERNFGKRPYYSCSMLGLPVFLITENNIISRAEKVSEERYAYCKAQYDHWQKSKAAFIYENESGELQGYPKTFMDKEIFKALNKHKVSAKIIYEVVGNLIQYGISSDDVYFRLMELCESGNRIILEFEKR